MMKNLCLNLVAMDTASLCQHNITVPQTSWFLTKLSQSAKTILTKEPETQKVDYKKENGEWKKEFKWLEDDTSEDVKYCGVCH